MPEPPDFEQIANRIADLFREVEDVPSEMLGYSDLIEELRLLWNARGAADSEVAFRAGFQAGFDVGREGLNHLTPSPFADSDAPLEAAEDAAVAAFLRTLDR